MVRMYIDWNVMSQIKAGNHQDFSKIISDDEKFFKLYSTSHLGDIAASDQSIANADNIKSDLEIISTLTGNYCVYNAGGDIIFGNESPHYLYNERIDLTAILDLLNPITDNKDENREKDELTTQIAAVLEAFKNQPLNDVFKNLFENPETALQMRQFLPDLENNYTQIGLITAIINMFKRLTENGDYKQLRTILQQGINIKRDTLFNNQNPYNMIQKAYLNKGIEYPAVVPTEEIAPQWFNEISNEYIKLDMHGYQEDKVKIDKGRKQTFKNTMEDAFHTAFATTCDFYITCDQKNYNKAEAVYEKLGKNTLVMTPDEFVKHYKEWLYFSGDDFLKVLPFIFKHIEPWINSKGTQRTYSTHFFIFNYFNKIHIITDQKTKKEGFVLLTRQIPTNSLPIFGNEISVLIDKLLSVFGEDLDNLKRLQEHEVTLIKEEKWSGRKWTNNRTSYKLRILEGHLQLYLYALPKKTIII